MTDNGPGEGAGPVLGPRSSADDHALRLTAERPRITRLSRKVLAGGGALALLLISGFQLPTFPAMPSSRPISISVNLESPRQMTVFPGGGSLDRAR